MKIAIIKLGAKGDVVRTLPILIALKEKHPQSEITWITKKSSEDIVKTSPHVSKVLKISDNIDEEFDILYNFDIEKEATELAKKISAKQKFGFCNDCDFVSTYNLGAEYYLNTLFDDYIKKTNKKTYQEIMFETAELPYKKEHHPIFLTKEQEKYGEEFLEKNNINAERLIGLHIGSSSRWPSKSWHEENVKDFITKAKQKGYEILLFGGPEEIEKLKNIVSEMNKLGIKIYNNNPNNSDIEFISLVNQCRLIVCADSLALHISLALKKPTLCLFFCTPPAEVEDYEICKKIISPRLYEFFPEKMDQYSDELKKSISVDEVIEEVERILKQK